MLGDKKALNNINLDIEKGSIFGVIGENGAGKTTLIKCMLGIYKQDEGEIKMNGKPVLKILSKRENRLCGSRNSILFIL